MGIATLFSPAILGFGTGGMLVAVVLGSLLIGMAVTISGDPGSSLGRHHLFDLAFAIAAALAALGLAIAGDAPPAAFLAAVAVIQTGLHLATRYVAAS